MYTTIEEKVNDAGWGGVVSIYDTQYRVQSIEPDCSVLVVMDCPIYAGVRVLVEYGDQARGYVWQRCDVCGKREYVRWSFKRAAVWRPVEMCITCYNRYHKRKAAALARHPIHVRNIIDGSRLHEIEVVRLLTGEERYKLRYMRKPSDRV